MSSPNATPLLIRRLLAVACRVVPLIGGAFAVTYGCAEYPLPPTDCDDWCVASQRAECAADNPVDCVHACEAQRAQREARGCVAVFHAETACLRGAPTTDFICDGQVSQPTLACVPERRAFLACMAPAGGPCFDLCQYQAPGCSDSLHDCETACLDLDPHCEAAATTYYECAVTAPLDCGPDPTPMSDTEQSPCFGEALEFLHCVGY